MWGAALVSTSVPLSASSRPRISHPIIYGMTNIRCRATKGTAVVEPNLTRSLLRVALSPRGNTRLRHGASCHDAYMSDPSRWSDEDDALVELEMLPDHHPALFVDAFRTGLELSEVDVANQLLAEAFVTPESRDSWGDFSRARGVFSGGLRISMTAWYARDAPDVAYIRLVDTDQHTFADASQIPATMHVTLVWRPEIARENPVAWRIHALGEAFHPDDVPRTAVGSDPR